MTEDISATTTEDVGPSAEVNTSTNEDTQATDDVSLEDMEIDLDELEDDDSETEESEESTEDEAATESEDESEEESQEDVPEAKEEDTTSEADEKAKAHEAFLKRKAEREAREKQIAESQEKYISEATDDLDLAVRQLQVNAYQTKVEGNHTKLESGIDRAVADIAEFSKGTQAEKESLAASLDDFERMFVKRDQYGNVIEVSGDVYSHLQNKAAEIRRIKQDGVLKGQKAVKELKTRTDTIPTRTPKEKTDTDLDDFDRAWDS